MHAGVKDGPQQNHNNHGIFEVVMVDLKDCKSLNCPEMKSSARAIEVKGRVGGRQILSHVDCDLLLA